MAQQRPVSIRGDKDRVLFDAGRQEGRRQTKAEVLGFLQSRYMHPSLDTSTPEAKAILKLAKEISTQIKQEID